MPIAFGVDLGTTKITAIAVELGDGRTVARATAANDADVTRPDDRQSGHSEWDAARIADLGRRCLIEAARSSSARGQEVAGVGVTGQQHGVLLVDRNLKPIAPLINWQDRRALLPRPGSKVSILDEARRRVGDEATARVGCRLQPGFLGTTLFASPPPAGATACFVGDYFVAALTHTSPVTEPSFAGSSGLFNVITRDWDWASIDALGLPRTAFCPIAEADRPAGDLSAEITAECGWTRPAAVFPAIGDHQASFLGAIADRQGDVLVNVGTGAQVAMFTDRFDFQSPVELRPLPIGGNLLSNVGLAGGWSYQLLESFFQSVAADVLQSPAPESLYDDLNRLAAAVPAGADGLTCEPCFNGTRSDPGRRGLLAGISPRNFTAAHFARAVLEGMARSLSEGLAVVERMAGRRPRRAIAAGNALRENAVLRECVATALGMPLAFTRHREEAAFGAALVTARSAGHDTSRLIAYESLE